ncbi:MAG: hypothetical protein PHH11_11470 [Methylomonas sp.]|nr:hypothetical protein [Methylomonas sp.]
MTIDIHDSATVDAFPAKRRPGRPSSANPKTAAQRMAESRRRRTCWEGERRLDLWLSTDALFALERLLEHSPDFTRQSLLEKLILEHEKSLTASMSREQISAYFHRNRLQKTES